MNCGYYFNNILLFPPEIISKVLDQIDEEGFWSLKKVSKEAAQFFQKEKAIKYFLFYRLPNIVRAAKTFSDGLPKQPRLENINCNFRLEKRKETSQVFFKVIRLLPHSILFPDLRESGYESVLRKLLIEFSCYVGGGLESSLATRILKISEHSDIRIPLFMTHIPTGLIPPTVRGFAEFSRRFPKAPRNDREFEEFVNFNAKNIYNLSNGCWASFFIRGISANLFQFILEKNPDNFFPGSKLIEAFILIKVPTEAYEKVLILGNWLVAHSANWAPHTHAQRLIYVLYMAALLEKKLPIDRNIIQSWIPKKYLSWDQLIEDDSDTVDPVSKEWTDRIKEHYGLFFTKNS